MNEIVDISRFIEAKSDQLNADDLIGGPRTITVTKVTGEDGDQPISIHYEGDNRKPFKPCKTIRRVLVAVWGRYGNDYVGRSMTLYRDDKVTFGGLEVGGIRISHMSHIEKEMIVVVAKSKGKKAGMKILPLKDAPSSGAADPAQKWADGYLAAVNKAADADALNKFANDKAAKLAELEAKRPELHRACVEALDARRASFAPADDEWGNDGTLAADNPTAAEGPADEQRGDSFADDEWGDTRSPADRIGDLIAEANGRASWEAAKAELERGKAEMSDDDAARLQAALDAKRASLVKG